MYTSFLFLLNRKQINKINKYTENDYIQRGYIVNGLE